MLMRAYLDDSDIGKCPTSVLAGFLGPADRWAPFADDWKAALEWRGISKFKMDEFLGKSGEFYGWDEQTGIQFIKYLVNLIRERAFKGIGVILPGNVYSEVFGKSLQRMWDNPYALMVFQLISITMQRFNYDDVERIDFVFDEQPGKESYIYSEWEKFKSIAPQSLRQKIGDPIFRSDEVILPLQAADLYAGWIRRIVPNLVEGLPPPEPPWSGQEKTMDSYTDFLTVEGVKHAYSLLKPS